ncbi:segmentation protein cap'n'collar isoform X1 [Anopheles funestus]|uniref:segmentation protein cap'n'collar isoform X1 n=1 Tax=Anopheles funestus TaxID=62324 RepID=UPI0020C68C85|nr:segmentation protein cap'n'collar isoform X1 [Anopheles funestus]
MLSTKKLFTEHLLTLVLTLSLLRIDPENYLDLQWGGRLARVGDAGGWQLELLAAGPDYSNQSYVNRKFLPPIIEDLSRFEQPFIEQNHRGLQTYLLNVLDSNDDSTSAGTIAEERPPSPVPSVASGGGGGTVLPAVHNATMNVLTNFDVDAEDIFLSTNLFEETTSVFEQNMADLSEYDTILLENPMVKFDAAASMPDLEGTIMRARSLMNSASEQHTAKRLEVKAEPEKEGEEEKASTSTSATVPALHGDTKNTETTRVNKTRAYDEEDDDDEDGEDGQDNKAAIRRQIKDQINTQQKHLVSTDLDNAEVTVKKEPDLANDTAIAPAAVPQDLTQEEMDLIEVLWKQDVDLGFTLSNAALSSAPEGTSSSGSEGASATNIKCDTEDDLEKLKVLLEIKNDKNADYEKNPEASDDSSLVDPWAGLSYTIDTETGEYVLNSSDIDNSLPPPLADLFLEEGLTLPDLGETVVDTIDDVPLDDGENVKHQTESHEEQEIAEVQRIERELQRVSVDENCLGAASGSTNAADGNCDDTGENLGTVNDTVADTATSDEGLDEDAPVTDDLEDLLCDMMIQTSSHFQHTRQNTQGYGHGAMSSFRQTATGGSGYHHHHHHHHHHHQSRVPLSRAVSMEQRWQDLANLLSFPPGMGVGMGVADMPPSHPSHAHYPSHYPSYQPSGAIAGPQHGQYHHPSHAAVLQNASLADISPAQPHYGANLGSAVATSMHLTNSTSETDAGTSGYKMDPEMMYYSNTSSEMNHTDGFLNSILNDEDLQLMDIAVNEGMYTMRMLEHNGTAGNNGASGMLGVSAGGASNLVNHGAHPHHHLSLMSSASATGAVGGNLQNAMNVSALVNGSSSSSASSGASSGLTGSGGGASSGATGALAGSGTPGDRLDASSDSAVSSMGSERVPSLSDGEWGDGGSDSAQEYHNGKYGGPYDYSYNQTNGGGPPSRMGEHGTRQAPPVAQKKHHMFAKRYFQEQNTTTVPSIHPSPNGAGVPTGPNTAAGQATGLDGSAPGAGGGGTGATGGVLLPTAIKYEYDYMNVVGPATATIGGPLDGAAKQEDHQSHLQHHHNGSHHESSAAAAAAAAALTDMKYPYGIDFPRSHHASTMGRTLQPQDMIHHNHTYTLPFATPNGGTAHQGTKPQTRDKSRSLHSRKAEEEHLTRDEKRARALQIPIPVHDIINLPMDEFNERLSKYDLSETQLSLIRDIRRRGKNKVAAQNCRKRKLDQIVTLADEVKDMKMRKERLMRDREMVLSEHKKIREKFSMLYRHVFQNLRDADGNPYSQEHYSLQQSADGAVVLVPRNSERPTGGPNHLNNGTNGTANGGSLHPSLHHSLTSSAGTHGHHHGHHHHHHPNLHQHLQHHGLLGGSSSMGGVGITTGGTMNGSMSGSLSANSTNGNNSSSSSGGGSGNGSVTAGSSMNGTASTTAAIVHQRTKE